MSATETPRLAHQEDCYIQESGESKTLYDSEGFPLFQFSPDWSDDEIWIALRFANSSYGRGHDMGVFHAQQDIKKALGLKWETGNLQERIQAVEERLENRLIALEDKL